MLGAGNVVPLITASDQTAFTAIFYPLVPVSLHRSITWMDTIVDYRVVDYSCSSELRYLPRAVRLHKFLSFLEDVFLEESCRAKLPRQLSEDSRMKSDIPFPFFIEQEWWSSKSRRAPMLRCLYIYTFMVHGWSKSNKLVGTPPIRSLETRFPYSNPLLPWSGKLYDWK